MTQATQILTRLKSLQEIVDKLSLRERLLVFAAALMLVGSAWQLALMQPLELRATNSRVEIEQLQSRTKENNQDLEDQLLQFSTGGIDFQNRLMQIHRRIDDINARLGDYAAQLIDPAEMARVLEGVLKKQSELRLIRLRNLTPEAILAPGEVKTTTFYKHGLEIEFEGSYFACLEYLQEIEALPWRFYWQILELEVLQYPQNRIRLEVSTISTDVEWIGA